MKDCVAYKQKNIIGTMIRFRHKENFFPLFAALCISLNSISQVSNQESDETIPFPEECHFVNLTPGNNLSKKSLPAGKIIITDLRPDKSKIGYSNGSKIKKSKRICVYGDMKERLTEIFTNFLKPCLTISDNNIQIYIKRIWVNDQDLFDSINNKPGCSISLKFEFYLQKDFCYYPLYRFDSTISESYESSKELDTRINSFLLLSIQKLLKIELADAEKKNCISYKQIDSFNISLKKYPILTSKEIKSGLYLTIEEFRQNNPSFVLSKTAKDGLYVIGKNQQDSMIVNGNWGFSNSNIIFIRRGYQYFPLTRSGDNFEFFAFGKINPAPPIYVYSQPITVNTSGRIPEVGFLGLIPKFTKKRTNYRIFMLDVESGKVY